MDLLALRTNIFGTYRTAYGVCNGKNGYWCTFEPNSWAEARGVGKAYVNDRIEMIDISNWQAEHKKRCVKIVSEFGKNELARKLA